VPSLDPPWRCPVRKDGHVQIRIPAQRKAAWLDAAGGRRHLSAWVRASAEAAVVAGVDPGTLRAELAAVRRELGAIGNNVNQLAHRANAGLGIDRADVARAAAAVDDMRQRVSIVLRVL